MHWAELRQAYAAAHQMAFVVTSNYMQRSGCLYPRADIPLQMGVELHPPTNQHYDLDNVLAAMKPYQDGIVHSLEVDDSLITKVILCKNIPVPGGVVFVTLSPIS